MVLTSWRSAKKIWCSKPTFGKEIEGKRLCPFRYFGIADDVDYSNIPWRNAQFNINELTAAIATEARARNSLEQFRKHGGSRCIAFCCSQRHADFMADFFLREGVKAVAVHSGPKSAPRATSLERLRDGDVEVIFAVDMFNEGVDVPSIDTVLMLRPTKSTIIWLQQIGRGLRISDGKERLVIIDYIGNHRAFLMKLRGMAVVVGRDVESSGRQRELLEAIRDERLILPAGCEVTYETTAIDILQHLLRPTRTEEAMQSFYRDFEERNGVRPLAVETFHAGLSPRSNSERSWLSFVERMGGLNTAEKVAWSTAREFLISLEKTEISRSYKIVLLQAMLEGDTLTPSLPIEEIARRVSVLATRVHRIAEDFSVDLSSVDRVKRLLIEIQSKRLLAPEGWIRCHISSSTAQPSPLHSIFPIPEHSERCYEKFLIGGSRSICHVDNLPPTLFVGFLVTQVEIRSCSCRQIMQALSPKARWILRWMVDQWRRSSQRSL